MAKRFTDTNKYKKPFVRGLQGAYKLLWDYLYHDCDHAGIWIVDFEVAQIYLGSDMPVNKEDALKFFNKNETRIIEVDNGKKWFIVPFIDFQYGELNESNRAHNSILKILKKYHLMDKKNKVLASTLQGGKDKDMDKDKEKKGEIPFEIFWDTYDKKIGDKKRCEAKWNKLKDSEREKIIETLPLWKLSIKDKQFQPYPETYLNQRRWNDEIKSNKVLSWTDKAALGIK